MNIKKLLTFLFTVYCLLLTNAYAASWKSFRNDAERTGYIHEQAYPPLIPRWSANVQDKIFSSPVVYKEKLFIGSRDGSIWAIDGWTGEIKSQYSADDWVDSTPSLSEDKLFVASRDGKIYMFNPENIEEPLGYYDTGSRLCSSPVIHNGKLYILTGHPVPNLLVFDTGTGQLIKSYNLSQYGFSSPSLSPDGNYVVVGTNDGVLHCIDLSTNQEKWSYQSETNISYGTCAIEGNNVYGVFGGEDRKVYKFDLLTGSIKWQSVELSATNILTVSSIAIYDNKLYFTAGYNIGLGWGTVESHLTAYCFDITNSTDTPKWTVDLGSVTLNVKDIDYSDILSSPGLANGVIYVGSIDGNLYAVNSSTGGILGKYYLGSSIVSSPALANGWIYVGTTGGKIYAFESKYITAISSPEQEESLNGKIDIKGFVVQPDGFSEYKVEYGAGESPTSWEIIAQSTISPSGESILANWDTIDLPGGVYSVKLTALGTSLSGAEAKVKYRIIQSVQETVGTEGKTISLGDGTEIIVPAGAVSESVTFSIINNYTYQGKDVSPPNARMSSDAREFTAKTPSGKDAVFKSPVTIKIPYRVGGINGLPIGTKEDNLRLWCYIGNEWVLVNGSKPNINTQKVEAEVNHFSLYRVGEVIPGVLLNKNEVYTYPNPARDVDTLFFKFRLGDVADVTIDVYNVAGDIVAHLERKSDPNDTWQVITLPWDISNIASGVYIYRVEAKSAGDTKSVTKKLAIIH